MWEYRIFEERDFSNIISDVINFDQIEEEERTDYYYDFGQNQYGMKERLNQNDAELNPKLELKIRLDKTSPLGVEYWEKVVSHEYPNHHSQHLPFYQIEDIISQASDQNEEYGSDIEYFQQQLPTSFEITKVSKKRWETKITIDGSIFDVEYGIIKILGETIYSFSIEGENLHLIEELIEQWGFDNTQFSGGYPSLVSALNKSIQPFQKTQ